MRRLFFLLLLLGSVRLFAGSGTRSLDQLESRHLSEFSDKS